MASYLGQAAAGIGTTGIGFAGPAFSWALGNKSANRYKSAVRHLRRREYQDMMFSMRKAGLNPILASGASPGHAQPMANSAPAAADLAGAFSKGAQSWRDSEKLPSEIKKMTAEKIAKEEQAGLFSAAAHTERERPVLVRSTIDNIRADTDLKAEQKAEAYASSMAKLKQAGVFEGSAKEIEARIDKIRQEEAARKLDEEFYDSTRGRIHREASRWLELIGLGSGTVPHSARSKSTETIEHYDAHGKPKGATTTRREHRGINR